MLEKTCFAVSCDSNLRVADRLVLLTFSSCFHYAVIIFMKSLSGDIYYTRFWSGSLHMWPGSMHMYTSRHAQLFHLPSVDTFIITAIFLSILLVFVNFVSCMF